MSQADDLERRRETNQFMGRTDTPLFSKSNWHDFLIFTDSYFQVWGWKHIVSESILRGPAYISTFNYNPLWSSDFSTLINQDKFFIISIAQEAVPPMTYVAYDLKHLEWYNRQWDLSGNNLVHPFIYSQPAYETNSWWNVSTEEDIFAYSFHRTLRNQFLHEVIRTSGLLLPEEGEGDLPIGGH